MKKTQFMILIYSMSLIGKTYADLPHETPVSSQLYVVGGGIIGALESYYAYKDAKKLEKKICIRVFEKGHPIDPFFADKCPSNTSFHIVPSLTIDEILSVVPRGAELAEKLAIPFNQPGGIRIDDVAGVNDSPSALKFKQAVTLYGSDINHEDRTAALLMLGKKSMSLWQEIYEDGDGELKSILEESNFNPCREPQNNEMRNLHDGYRIDLLYGIQQAQQRALDMQMVYEKLGYNHCAILTPSQVMAIDPYLADFCFAHSEVDDHNQRHWQDDCVALWRPGGCIDTRAFLPKFYGYLKNKMGQYLDANNQIQDCFQLEFQKEVIAVELDHNRNGLQIRNLKFSDGTCILDDTQSKIESHYVFCPGESVGTLQKLGFNEPDYAGFAGPSLLVHVPLTSKEKEKFKGFSHCMEVHKEGIVLAWQARCKENSLFIGVAGTKAFYGDKEPKKDEVFALDRNLLQLNMINQVLPEIISLAFGYDTKGKSLTVDELLAIENRGTAQRWVGRRAVAYDGFPTIGCLYNHNRKVVNARCTTHLGSGGVSFGPGAVFVSRASENDSHDLFIQKILHYADSRRIAE